MELRKTLGGPKRRHGPFRTQATPGHPDTMRGLGHSEREPSVPTWEEGALVLSPSWNSLVRQGKALSMRALSG